MVVEDPPRLTIQQIQAMPEWPRWAEERLAKITVFLEGTTVPASIRLDSTALTFGWRWWLICPACAARRYTLIGIESRLCCRGCAREEGKGLLYLQQSWDRRYREEFGLPLLKAWRQLQPGKYLVSSSLRCTYCNDR